ncbi:hypothetical protein GGF31_004857 [Allomyces arbusculus]|nr:hypothetical protein GGF31_004857 [Allomyces arbusculus]
MTTPARPRKVYKSSLYMRPMPECLVDFSSREGKALFRQALEEGHMETYFRLAAQFTTQADPAFCGLGTLCMVLNTLNVDPLRQWRYSPWRWYDDEMLDCCRSLDDVRDKGITISEFGCLATCNGLRAKVHRADLVTKEQFLEDIIRTSQCDDEVLVVSYFRGTLGQTGSGHFSPLGGYCAATNSVLILDVARFKYPPYWCPVDLIWDAMHPHDPVTDKPRGYVLMSRSQTEAALPKLNLTTTTVARLVHHLTVEFPHKLANDPKLASLTPVDVLARALACVPEELAHNVLTEREVHEIEDDSSDGADVDADPAPSCGTGCCAPKASRAAAYQAEFTQLLHAVHELPLYHDVVAARASAACDHADQAEHDPERANALLTLVLLSFAVATIIPPEHALAEAAPECDAALRAHWDLERVPLIVKREVVQLRMQMDALKCAACDEVVATVHRGGEGEEGECHACHEVDEVHAAHAEANEAA